MWKLLLLIWLYYVASNQIDEDVSVSRPLRGRVGGGGGQRVTPVPMIAVTLNEDRRKYLNRLLKSIDYPVDLVLITIGNSNATALQEMKSEAERGKSFLKKRFRGAVRASSLN